MSTSYFVFGQFDLPDAADDLRAAKLTPLKHDFFGSDFRAQKGGDLLDEAPSYGLGVMSIQLQGEGVTLRMALGEDRLSEYAARVAAFLQAAAKLGASGEVLFVQREEGIGYRLLLDGEKVKTSPLSAVRIRAALRSPACREVNDLLLEKGESANKAAPKKEGAAPSPSGPPPGKAAPEKASSGEAAPERASPDKPYVKRPADPAGVVAALGDKAHPEAIKNLRHADFRVQQAAAKVLVAAGDPAGLSAVAEALDGADWQGGPFSSMSVAALFKLDPTTALDRLKPFVAAVKKAKTTPSMPLLDAFHLLVLGPAGIGLQDAALEGDLVAKDPRWIDVAEELVGVPFSTLKGLPEKLLKGRKAKSKAHVKGAGDKAPPQKSAEKKAAKKTAGSSAKSAQSKAKR